MQTKKRLGLRVLLLASCALSITAAEQAQQISVSCTNAATDGPKVNKAISSSPAGSIIRIHGTCLTNETVVLKGNRTYEGDSRTGTIIRQASGANLAALVASDSWASDWSYTGAPVHLTQLTIDANSSANVHTNALVIRSWFTTIDDVFVQNAPGDGIQLTNLSKNGVALETTQVNGHISNITVAESGGNGIHIVDTGNSVTDWSLLDSWIANSGLSAMYFDNAAGWNIRGNHLYGVKNHAIFANRCFGTTIDQNYIEDFGGAGGSTTWYGIACTAQGDAASIINGNKVFMLQPEQAGSRFVYIGVPWVNYGVGQLTITGNAIRGAGTHADVGLDYQNNGGVGLRIMSSNNGIEQVDTPRTVGAAVKLIPTY